MKEVIKKWETILSEDETKDITYGRKVLLEMLSDFKKLHENTAKDSPTNWENLRQKLNEIIDNQKAGQ